MESNQKESPNNANDKAEYPNSKQQIGKDESSKNEIEQNKIKQNL